LNTLVRGQKLPIFSGPGLPALELAAQIVTGARAPRGEPFAVVFVAMGITHRESQLFLARCAGSGAAARTVLYLNETADPPIERLLAPRVALAAAEFLAFEAGLHVLLVMADVTHYAEALREISTAREEIPGRRGYPGYLYTDLASLFERAGILAGRPGSLTQVPVLTMPDDDITHPIPDLTGYITEGQVVLSAEVQARGVYPPVDPLASLSRLMRHGAGPGRTRDDHLDIAAQLLAALARARQVRELADLVGAAALSATDRSYLELETAFEQQLLQQHSTEVRSLDDTLDRAWQVASVLPRRELTTVPAQLLDRHYRGRG
ncbi:MAG: V-type ATP synthase subunit B, partial [Kribbellaceae bacterium]